MYAYACSHFTEMMHHNGGVFNVVVGGHPSYGPMQTPCGSRGARYYDVAELDADIYNAIDSTGLPDRTTDYYVHGGGVSL